MEVPSPPLSLMTTSWSSMALTASWVPGLARPLYGWICQTKDTFKLIRSSIT